MNNSLLVFEETEELSPALQQRKANLVKILSAIESLSKIDDWKVLKGLVFDGMVENLEKSLQIESKKNELNAPDIYRLQGRLAWARRYSDLYKLAEDYKVELNNITKKLNENAQL